jgi:hypothetical protein
MLSAGTTDKKHTGVKVTYFIHLRQLLNGTFSIVSEHHFCSIKRLSLQFALPIPLNHLRYELRLGR